jgi:hypothetical protein
VTVQRDMCRRCLPLLLIVGSVYVSSASANDRPEAKPELATDISIAHCLDVIGEGVARNPSRCPAFLIEPLKEALQTCSEAGGKLVPTASTNVWEMDVNGDNKKEFTFEYEDNVDCEGAGSVFSCGSLGCPATLYENYQSGWRPIAQLDAGAIDSIELLKTRATGRYPDLRVGCVSGIPCTEYSYYHWTGAHYEPQRLEVRGFTVAFADSLHGLYPFVGDTALLATPTPEASVIAHYGSETEVAIIGTAEHAAYYYVSPCNACESGFVPKSAVRVPPH